MAIPPPVVLPDAKDGNAQAPAIIAVDAPSLAHIAFLLNTSITFSLLVLTSSAPFHAESL